MKYIKPLIELINISKEDIITTSGTAQSITEALFGKGNGGVKL